MSVLIFYELIFYATTSIFHPVQSQYATTVKPNTLWTRFHANISITAHHIVMEPHILAYVVEIDMLLL